MTTERADLKETVPGNLPAADETSFVGRSRSVNHALRAFEESRLVTLTGAGGIGKTRLAYRIADEIAEQRAEDFPDGLWLVSLAELTKPELIAAHLAEVLEWTFNSAEPISLRILLDRLSKLRLLLLLDNCEHHTDDVAGLVRRVLQVAPGVRILATSRVPLQVPGEYVMMVGPLDTGNDDPFTSPPDTLYEAVQLLLDRAKSAGIELRDADRADATRLCQLLDGIPLAIELAAKRLRAMGIKDLLSKIEADGRFSILDAEMYRRPPQHSTLSATISESWEACTPAQQHLWDRLSVFQASFRLEDAEKVAADSTIPAEDVAGLLLALVDRSLVVADIRDGQARYRMLIPMRSYAEQKLRERGEETKIRQAHAEHYKAWAASLSGAVLSPHEVEWLQQVRVEMPSFREALDWFLTTGQEHQALELAVALSQSRWCYYLGQLHAGRVMLERALDAQTEPHPLQVMGRTLLVTFGVSQGDHNMVRARIAEAADISAQLGSPPDLESWVLFGKALVMLYADADPRSIDVVMQAEQLWLSHAPKGSVYPARNFAAMCAAYLGEREFALRISNESLAAARKAGAPVGINWAVWCCGIAELNHGSAYRAIELFLEALTGGIELGDRWGPTWFTASLAWTFVEVGRFEQAAVLMGAVAEWQQDTVHIMDVGIVKEMHSRRETVARARLGSAEFCAATARGKSLSRNEVLAFAQEHAAGSGPSIPGGLSEREYEIAGLVAAAMTNRQIADHLVISVRTVDAHLRTINSKLDFSGPGSRVEVGTWWGRQQR